MLSRVCLVLGLVAFLAACKGPQLNVKESCEVLKATLYSDGQFMFTDAEIDALREVNQVKIIAVKKYYRAKCVK